MRQELIDTGRLVPSVGGLLTFAEDTTFNSPSSAASVINTCARNGKTSWVLEGSSMTIGKGSSASGDQRVPPYSSTGSGGTRIRAGIRAVISSRFSTTSGS